MHLESDFHRTDPSTIVEDVPDEKTYEALARLGKQQRILGNMLRTGHLELGAQFQEQERQLAEVQRQQQEIVMSLQTLRQGLDALRVDLWSVHMSQEHIIQRQLPWWERMKAWRSRGVIVVVKHHRAVRF